MWGGGRYFAQDRGVYSLACARNALGVDSFQCEQFQNKGKKGVSSYRISKARLPKLRPRLLPSQARLRRAPRERGHEEAQAPPLKTVRFLGKRTDEASVVTLSPAGRRRISPDAAAL